jgi:hypothetical protein
MSAYAPTAGRLAAAMATISAKRRPIRDRVERNSEFNGRISIIPGASRRKHLVSQTNVRK